MTEVITKRELAPLVLPTSQELLDRVGDDIADLEDSDLAITNPRVAELVSKTVGRVATVLDTMEKERLEATKQARDAISWFNDGYKPVITRLDAAIRKAKAALLVFDRDQRAKADALQRKLDAEAAQRKRDAEADAMKARQEADRLAHEAEAAAKAGDAAAAARLADEASALADQSSSAEVVAASAVAPIVPSGGVKGRSLTWKGKMVNKRDLLIIAANRPECEAFFDLNQAALDAFARLSQGKVKFDGAEFYQDAALRTTKQPV